MSNRLDSRGLSDGRISGVGNLTSGTSAMVITGGNGAVIGSGTAITLSNFGASFAGLVPLSGGGSSNFLRADGTWTTVSGGGGSPGGSANQLQWNSAGSFAGITNSTGADASGYIFPRNTTFSLPGPRNIQTDCTNWAIMTWAGRISKAWAIAKTGPTGAALIVDILKSTNNGVGFTSIWSATPANRLTIAAAAVAGDQTSFDGATFAAGDLFRIDVAQVGSTRLGSDITVALTTVTQNT